MDDRDNFDTSDLFEDKNLNQVCICLINLGRAAYHIDGYQGPCLGKPIAAASGGKHAAVKTTGLWGKGALRRESPLLEYICRASIAILARHSTRLVCVPAGGDFSTTDRPTAGSSGGGGNRGEAADEFRVVDATSTEWKHDGPAAAGTAAAFAQEIAGLAPSRNLAYVRDSRLLAACAAAYRLRQHRAAAVSATKRTKKALMHQPSLLTTSRHSWVL